MGWSDVVRAFDRKIVDETRAGILVGVRLELSDSSSAAIAVQQWAHAHGDVVLWIVDDLNGLAPRQPCFAGVVVLEAFGKDGDHRDGLAPSELARRVASARARIEPIVPALGALAPIASPVGAWFVWSGPLCGGWLVKGAFRDTVDDAKLWYQCDDECRVYRASRGGSQEAAPGGVLGVELFSASYDCSDEPIELTAALLASRDDALARAGLLDSARVFALPHYD